MKEIENPTQRERQEKIQGCQQREASPRKAAMQQSRDQKPARMGGSRSSPGMVPTAKDKEKKERNNYIA